MKGYIMVHVSNLSGKAVKRYWTGSGWSRKAAEGLVTQNVANETKTMRALGYCESYINSLGSQLASSTLHAFGN